jgi:hypothetical protein
MLGLGQAQVWSDQSVSRLHPALVAAYALLKLAAIKAFGPIWQPQSTRPPPDETLHPRETYAAA